MSNTVVEPDLEELLSAAPPVCQHHSGCSQPAAWLLRCRGANCMIVGLVCHHHRGVFLAEIAREVARRKTSQFHCTECKRTGTLEYVMELRPI